MKKYKLRKPKVFSLTCILCTCIYFELIAQNTLGTNIFKRDRTCFDSNWMFHKGDIVIKRAIKSGKYGGLTDISANAATGGETEIAYSDSNKAAMYNLGDWRQVNLPHDWCVEGKFVNDNSIGSAPSVSGYLPTGIGFYRKEFEVSETDKGRKIFIEFDGIFRNSTVWVNGHLLGNHQSGYTPSCYDVTDVVRYGKEGKNVILVKVDATEYEGWWYEGCGIYRHVWLTKMDKLHIGRFGTYVTTPLISTDRTVVDIKTTLKNEYKLHKKITVVSKILDARGVLLNRISSVQEIEPLGQIELSQSGSISKPMLWSPETPNLYRIRTELIEDGNIVDTYETVFGIRTIKITNEGFFLNGKRYPVKGTANHQDFAGVGVALPDKLNEYKIGLLKDMGCNAYRCAHHPPTPELLDICDRLGMLVMDENRLLSSSEEGLMDLTTMLYRDRNHPSVFIWGMENEETIQGTAIGTRIVEKMIEITHKIDPTRPTTAAMNHGWNDHGYSDVLDVVGYNYGQRGMQYVIDKYKFPDRKMFVTESTSFTTTRGEYEDNKEKGYVSNLGTNIPSWAMPPGKDWEQIVKYPYLSGMFAWTGFDYRGEPTPYEWPCVTSQFGIMDICGFPKDGYYAYLSAWSSKPVVHIFPHWNWHGKEGQVIKVQGYSNCSEVELFLNGKSIGRKQVVPFNKIEWNVAYQPGRLEAKGYDHGKFIAKDFIETTTGTAYIEMKSDRNTLNADNCDVAVIKISIKDDKGRIVPTANDIIKFSIKGPGKIIGTGNGNPSSHEPDKADQRMAFNGYCLVLIQSTDHVGEICLNASSGTLKGAEIRLKVN